MSGRQSGPTPRHGRFGRLVPLLALAVILGCADGGDELSADDATDCRELGGGLVYLRYEPTDAGTEVRVQPGITYDEAQTAPGLSSQARDALVSLGWDDDALEELQGGEPLSPEVAELLDRSPSCLDELRDVDAAGHRSVGSANGPVR